MPHNVARRSTDPSVAVAASKRNLETSVEREMPEGLTLDVLTRSSRSGNLKRMSEGWIGLPWSPGCRGSLGAKTEDSRSSASASIQREKMKSLTVYVPDLHSHLKTTPSMPTWSLDQGVNAEGSKRNLEMLIKRKRSRTLTLDALTRSDRPGDLKRMSEGQINLLSDIGSRGSAGTMTESMDEGLCDLQSAQSIWARRDFQIR